MWHLLPFSIAMKWVAVGVLVVWFSTIFIAFSGALEKIPLFAATAVYEVGFSFIFILLYGISQSLLKWVLLKLGYTLGTSFIDTVFNSGLMSVATRCASILGLMMVGAMTATTVGFPLNWTLNIGETSIVVSELFDAIYPGILSLALVLFMMWRIKKGNRPTQLIIGLLIFGLLGAFLGIF